MSCPSSKSNKNIVPIKTNYMKMNNKKYVWKSVGTNPNKYCWVPVSGKYMTSKIPIENIDRIQDAPEPPNAASDIEKIQKMPRT